MRLDTGRLPLTSLASATAPKVGLPAALPCRTVVVVPRLVKAESGTLVIVLALPLIALFVNVSDPASVANVPVVTVDGGVDVFPVFRSTRRIFGVPEESSTIAFPSETVLAVAIELPFGAVYTVRSEPSAFRATNWFERTRISSPDQVWSLVAAFESVTDCDETVAGVVDRKRGY